MGQTPLDKHRRMYPEAPIVAVGALIYDEEEKKILLIRRASDPGKGKFSIPGGVVELGENLINAVKREVMEEVNIDCEVLGVINIVNVVERDDEGRVKWHYVIIDFLAKPKSKVVKPETDALDAIWVSLDDAFQLPLTYSTRNLLKKFKKMLTDRKIEIIDVENLMFG